MSNIKILALLKGLDTQFQGIGDEGSLEAYYDEAGMNGRREIMMRDHRYGYYFHTHVYEGDSTLEDAKSRHERLQRRMREHFLETITTGSHIFVQKTTLNRSKMVNILPMLFALQRYGDNTLLWVMPEDDLHDAGTTEVVTSRLMIGYVDRFSTLEVEHNISHESWLQMLDCALTKSKAWRT